jgi:DNA-directed RNA polymerase specialized sigma24 family protein
LGSSFEGDEEAVTRTFERFWHAVDGAKFARFGSLSAVLQYLKMCAQATRIDRMRAANLAKREQELDDMMSMPAHHNVELEVAGRVDAAGFWSMVQRLLADDRERLVIYLSYVIGLTPREICRRHETTFPDVSDVYRLKRNALDRLRRAAEMKAFRE